jgi:hypothetical protein
MSDLLRFPAERYRHDGGCTAGGVALLTATGLVTAAIAGAIGSFISQWFYLVLLFPLLIGFAVGMAAVWAIKVGHVRNSLIAGVVGFLSGLMAMFVMHYCDFARFNSEMRATLEKEPPQVAELLSQLPNLVATRDNQPPQIQEFIDNLKRDPEAFRALMVHDLPSYFDFSAHVGVSINSYHSIGDKDRGLNLGYVGSYIYWGVEVLMVAMITYFCASFAAAEPYCMTCNTWKVKQPIGSLQPPVETAVDALKQGELARLQENRPMPGACPIRVIADICPKCATNSPIDVKLLHVTRGKKNEEKLKTLTHVTLPGAALAPLQQMFAAKNS